MALKYEAVVTQRYEQNGEEKKRYIRVGAVFEGAKGLSLKLDSIPVSFDGWIQFYEPKPKEDKPSPPDNKPADDDSDGPVPF